MGKPIHPSISFLESPNRSSRRGTPILGTVIHYTASAPGVRGDVAWLLDPRAVASAHFVIARDGGITQLVDVAEAAWHAGTSWAKLPTGKVWRGCNLFTIGIELDNLGLLHRDEDGALFYEEGADVRPYTGPTPLDAELVFPDGHRVAGLWEPYPDPQLDALQRLLRLIADAGHREAASNLYGHDEVALPMGRKTDPGPAFPWQRFGRKVDRPLVSALLSS